MQTTATFQVKDVMYVVIKVIKHSLTCGGGVGKWKEDVSLDSPSLDGSGAFNPVLRERPWEQGCCTLSK